MRLTRHIAFGFVVVSLVAFLVWLVVVWRGYAEVKMVRGEVSVVSQDGLKFGLVEGGGWTMSPVTEGRSFIVQGAEVKFGVVEGDFPEVVVWVRPDL